MTSKLNRTILSGILRYLSIFKSHTTNTGIWQGVLLLLTSKEAAKDFAAVLFQHLLHDGRCLSRIMVKETNERKKPKKKQTKKWADPIFKIVTGNYFWSPRKSFDYSSTSNVVQKILSPSAMQDSHSPITQGGKTMFSNEHQDKTTLSLVYFGSPLSHSSCGHWLIWCHKGVLSGQQRRASLCRTVSKAWLIAEYPTAELDCMPLQPQIPYMCP